MGTVKGRTVAFDARSLALERSVAAQLQNALIFAAREQQVVRYCDFHAFFGDTGTLRWRFELFDRVIQQLADPADADYGSLMANSPGLPGPEFLRRYRVFHADEYETIVGGNALARPKLAQRLRIALAERHRVYHHALRQWRNAPEISVWTQDVPVRTLGSRAKP
ncbi:hypothetical protein [Paraburkholderia terrae]|uniref:hypothetical protein n=1 Tax=Paraburkholderia terrae TaxID=311230 RepID=UPI001EE37B80|nr:hypothetical protein [Paraburkholderia terrae]GJH04563.1 hypothetical protein CBA19C8_28420 [Paraburkholderia terrae]